MAVFAISDLHLSLNTNKPMDVFGGWKNYVERLTVNWKRMINDEDTVVIPGDISWALKIDDALEDFKYIDNLPGTKIILKGNHDLWWGTVKKLYEFFQKNNITTIKILFNNSIEAENFAICGTRGWFYDSKETDKKIVLREAARLEQSIKQGLESEKKLKVFLHYPPVFSGLVCNELISVLKKYEITEVFHGHIHGAGIHKVNFEYDNIKFRLISADCIDFCPIRIG